MGNKSHSGTGNHKLPGESNRGVDGHTVIDNEEFNIEEQSRRATGSRLLSEELEEFEENLQMFGDFED